MPLRALGPVLVLVLAAGCRPAPPPVPPAEPEPVAAREAVDPGRTERTLTELSLAAKAAKLVAVRATSRSRPSSG